MRPPWITRRIPLLLLQMRDLAIFHKDENGHSDLQHTNGLTQVKLQMQCLYLLKLLGLLELLSVLIFLGFAGMKMETNNQTFQKVQFILYFFSSVYSTKFAIYCL